MPISPMTLAAARTKRGKWITVGLNSLFLFSWFFLQNILGIPVLIIAAVPALISSSGQELSMTELLSAIQGSLMPGGGLEALGSFASLLATIFAVFILRLLGGPRLLDFGLRPQQGWKSQTLLGLLLGPIVFGAILLIELAYGWASASAGQISLWQMISALVMFICVAYGEEIFSRGFVLQTIEKSFGPWAGAIVSSIIFAFLHGLNPNISWIAILNLFLAGMLFAYAYLATRQLWLPVALHLSWNFAQGPLFGFPVSGMSAPGLFSVNVNGPALFTGAAFGPEAGILGILGMLVCFFAITWYSKLTVRKVLEPVIES